MVSVGNFLIFMEKSRKPTATACTTCTFSFLGQNQKDVFLVQDSTHLPSCSWTAVFLLSVTAPRKANSSPLWMEMLNFSVHIASTNLPWEPFREWIDLQPISTKLTFKPQPLIEHWVISVCVCSTVPGSQGSAFTEVGWTQEPCSSSHTATDGRGSGGWARTGQCHRLLEHIL